MQVNLVNRRLLVAQRIFGVLTPFIGGGDDDALRETFFAGRGKKTVNVFLADAVVGRKIFTLDGVKFRRAARPRHEVNAGVLGIDAKLRRADFARPIGEQPDIGIQVRVAGLETEIGADEFLEISAFLALGLGGSTVFVEDVVNGLCRHAVAPES